jgi:hypothetical protein
MGPIFNIKRKIIYTIRNHRPGKQAPFAENTEEMAISISHTNEIGVLFRRKVQPHCF